jgi:hypothetical protein
MVVGSATTWLTAHVAGGRVCVAARLAVGCARVGRAQHLASRRGERRQPERQRDHRVLRL